MRPSARSLLRPTVASTCRSQHMRAAPRFLLRSPTLRKAFFSRSFMGGESVQVESPERASHLLCREFLLDASSSGGTARRSELRVGQKSNDAIGKRARVSGLGAEAGLAVDDRLAFTAERDHD